MVPKGKAWVTYLELRRPLKYGCVIPKCAEACRVARESLHVTEYLQLFRLAGERVGWDLRTRGSSEEVVNALKNPNAIVFVLRIDGSASGLCEFRKEDGGDLELLFFGIAKRLEGRGFGRFLLCSALELAWEERPGRIWLHTDTYDSPRALMLYEQVGFKLLNRKFEDIGDF